MSSAHHRSTLEGMPKQFVTSLRTLFDILDEEQTGFVRLSDIESRWKGENVNGLPKGVVDALRKVTPASGKLTFERFIAGLKISLLRSKVPDDPGRKQKIPEKTQQQQQQQGATVGVSKPGVGQGSEYATVPDLLSHGPSREPHSHSNPPVYGSQASGGHPHNNHVYPGNQEYGRSSLRSSQHDPQPPAQNQYPQNQRASQPSSQYGPATAAVRPNNALPLSQQRTKSAPQIGHQQANRSKSPYFPELMGDNYESGVHNTGRVGNPGADPLSQSARPHSALRHETLSTGRLGWSQNQAPSMSQAGKTKDEIVSALKQWQRDRMNSEGDATDNGRPAEGRSDPFQHNNHNHFPSGPAAGPIDKRPLSIASTSAFEHFGRDPLLQSQDELNKDPLSAAANRRAARRKEPRRHTLANGIDYNMIKRMKQLEQEKDILLQGLESVERARDWYLAQIRSVENKQKYVGKASGPNDYSVEAHQERMNFQHARISEVNQQLKALVDSSEKGFPLHMNLALSQRVKPQQENTETSNIVAMLKGQNRLLTNEVSEKSDKISQLEREKAALIRDLFESRSKNRNNNYDDTTFM